MRDSAPQSPVFNAERLHGSERSKRTLFETEDMFACGRGTFREDVQPGRSAFLCGYLLILYLKQNAGLGFRRSACPIGEQTSHNLTYHAYTRYVLDILFGEEARNIIKRSEHGENVEDRLVIGHCNSRSREFWLPFGAQKLSI